MSYEAILSNLVGSSHCALSHHMDSTFLSLVLYIIVTQKSYATMGHQTALLCKSGKREITQCAPCSV